MLALLQGVELYDEMTASWMNGRSQSLIAVGAPPPCIDVAGSCTGCCFLRISLGLAAAFLARRVACPGSDTAAIDRVDRQGGVLIFALSLPAWIVVTKLYGLYDQDEERTDHSTTDDVVGVFHMVTVCAWLFFAFAYLTKVAHPRLPKLLLFWALAIGFVSVGRAIARAYCRRQINYLQNTIIVGAGDVGQLVARKLLKHPEYGINLVGFVDAEPKERREDLENLTLLGPPERLPALVRLLDIERVIVAFSSDSHEQTLDLIRSMKDLEVQVDIVPRFFELVGPGVGIHTVEGLPLIGLAPPHLSPSSRFLKRSLDLVAVDPSRLSCRSLFALIAIAIKAESARPCLLPPGSNGPTGTRPFGSSSFARWSRMPKRESTRSRI